MLTKTLLGLTIGSGAGYAYNAIAGCMGGVCHCDRPYALPMLIGAALGVLIALGSAK